MSANPTAADWMCSPAQKRLFHVFPAGPMCSLRRALLLWLVPLFLVVGASSAAISYWSYSRMVNEFMDGQMEQLAQAMASNAEIVATPQPTAERIHAWGAYVTQLYAADGKLLQSSWPALTEGLQPTGFADLLIDGVPWRAYTSAPPGAGAPRIQILQSGLFRSRLAAERAATAIAPVLLLLPLAILILWGLARAMSSAIEDIGKRAALQDAHNIVELPLERVPREIQPLVVSFNSLLTRLRDSFADQRRFVQDAAHELRTPITALVLQLENVRGDLPPGACAESFAHLEAGLHRAQRLVEQLLKMSRQQGPVSEPEGVVDLRALLRESIDSLIALADQRHIDLGLVDALAAGSPAPTWRCAPGDLRSVLDNLIENALRHTPEDGVVDVRLLSAGDGVAVEVADSGPGIAPEFLDRVFDRFYRVPGSIARGSGLGLAIAQAAAQRWGLRIRLDNRRDGRGLIARVEPAGDSGAQRSSPAQKTLMIS